MFKVTALVNTKNTIRVQYYSEMSQAEIGNVSSKTVRAMDMFWLKDARKTMQLYTNSVSDMVGVLTTLFASPIGNITCSLWRLAGIKRHHPKCSYFLFRVHSRSRCTADNKRIWV